MIDNNCQATRQVQNVLTATTTCGKRLQHASAVEGLFEVEVGVVSKIR